MFSQLYDRVLSESGIRPQISFLYVDLLDTTGTLVAMSKQAGLFDARDGDFEGSSVAFLVDSACIAMSGLFFGSSPCTPFVGEF